MAQKTELSHSIESCVSTIFLFSQVTNYLSSDLIMTGNKVNIMSWVAVKSFEFTKDSITSKVACKRYIATK